MKKNLKTLNWTVGIIGLLYLSVLFFPKLLFAEKMTYKNFNVYYHSEAQFNANDLKAILNKSLLLLEQSEIYAPEKKQDLFLCNSYNEFTFFAPRSRKAFAVNYPISQNIFLTTSNISSNKIIRNDSQFNLRTLSAVIAHETTHSLLEDELGFFKYKVLPSWKNEGYCDYIAQESSYKASNPQDEICKTSTQTPSPSYVYFKYRMLTEHLFKTKKTTLKNFIKQSYDLEELENEFCANKIY